MDEEKASSDVKVHLGHGTDQFVNIYNYYEFDEHLEDMVSKNSKKIWVSKKLIINTSGLLMM